MTAKTSPPPPDPRRRRRPLPEQVPKDASDDPHAPAAIRAIVENPSYREADRDLDFLQEDVSRGVRLQLEYLKTETVLQKHKVAHTVVVFGGTRILEPQAAKRQLAQARAAITQWIQWYNAERPHQALDYRSPRQFRALQPKLVA